MDYSLIVAQNDENGSNYGGQGKPQNLENVSLTQLPSIGFDRQPFRNRISAPILTSRSKIEANRWVRNPMEYDQVDLRLSRNKSREFELWKEASENDPPYPDHYDPEYNSNVWRNFARESGVISLSSRGRVSESIAKMHPLPIPPYNRLGRYTFAKFLSEVSVIPNNRKNQGQIIRHLSDLKEFKRLKLKSEGRRPPVDLMGRIVPPSTMKKYTKRINDSPEPVGPDNDPPYYIVDLQDSKKLERNKSFPVRYIFKENPLRQN
ncbi:uncharacterized protein LOC142356343 [Convolutriloba macropyga]|uniref:uncharacterized protein LOC142356343 n=1 Tax=Convolutriloba macropyga TaxID=536237 RepID=UPI003F5215EF